MYEAKKTVSNFAEFRNAFRGVKSWEQKLHLFETSATGEEYPTEFVSASIEEARAHAESQATCDECGTTRRMDGSCSDCRCENSVSWPLARYERGFNDWTAGSVSGMCGILRVTALPEGKSELRLIFASRGGSLIAAVKAAGWTVYGF